jgi:uncharacterized protein YktA (UPF0223 family)
MKVYLYLHTSPSKKHYVGITTILPEQRWRKNGRGYKTGSQKKFERAIIKYGWDNFNHEILCECSTLEEAKELEIFFIKKYDSYYNGYNSTLGGDGCWKINNVDWNEIQKLYNSGVTKVELCKKYKIAFTTFERHIKLHPVGYHSTLKIDWENVQKLYDEGMPTKELAIKFNCSRKTVNNHIFTKSPNVSQKLRRLKERNMI